MINFTGLVMSVNPAKDGTKQYVEMTDREAFARYRVSLPMAPAVAQGDVITVEILGIRAYNSQVSIEGKVSADQRTPSLRSSETK
jgi:hypothetical protein